MTRAQIERWIRRELREVRKLAQRLQHSGAKQDSVALLDGQACAYETVLRLLVEP